MSGRVFDGRIAQGIAPDDRARQDRLKATARALVTAVRDGLVRDGVVRLHGFGTFRLRPVAARRGRHPRTGEPIDIPAGWRVMFRPAKALRERVEPDRAPALPIGEPHASREAMLAASPTGAAQTSRRGAGRIPAGGPEAPRPDEPGRAAAAAMPEPKRSVQGPIPPGPIPAGRILPGPTPPTEPVDLEADSRVTRSPAALTRAPAANEPAAAESPPGERSGASPDIRPNAATDAPVAGRGYRSALLALLLLVLAGLAWLLRPGDAPAPPVAEVPDTSTSDRVSADAGSGAEEIVTTAGASRESENAAATTDATARQDETGDAVVRADDPSADTPSGAGDEPVESAPASGDGETAGAPESDPSGSGGTIVRGDAQAMATPSTDAAAAEIEVPAPSAGGAATTDDGALAALSGAGGATSSASTETPTDDGAAAKAGDAAEGGDGMAGGEEGATGAAETPATAGDATGTAAADGSPYFSGRDYTVRSGDTLWDLADRHYVNPYYWPHIWQHNADIANPDRLEVRQGLWLPTLEGDPRSLTEADRRSIAQGYLLLYRFFRDQGDANPQYALVGVRYFDPSVLPERLRGTAAGHPGDTLAAAFQARLEAEFPLD